jgi:HEAT repeat protein
MAVLEQALSSPDYATRLIAVEALGDVKGIDVAPWLEKALGDPEHDVRMSAVDSLARLGTARGRALLQSVRDDVTEDLDVRAFAAAALLRRAAD